MDRSNGFYYGFAVDYAAQAEAEARAIQECAKRGGNCAAVLVWSGTGCGAYRTVPDNVGTAYGWGVARSREEADAIALREATERSGDRAPTNYAWGCNSPGPRDVAVLRNDAPDQDPARLLIGKWRDENSGVTHEKNGSCFVKWDSGNQRACSYNLERGFLTYTYTGGIVRKYRVVEMTRDAFTMQATDGSTWHASRVN